MRKGSLLASLSLLLLGALYVAGTHLDQPLLPNFARRTAEAIGLQQYWVVFAPRNAEATTDGWFVAPGLAENGAQVDLFNGDGPVSYDPPELVSSSFQNRRWRHFYANLIVEWRRGSVQSRDIFALRQATGRWLCADYRDHHPGGPALLRASLYFVEHSIDRPEDGTRRRLIAQTTCQ